MVLQRLKLPQKWQHRKENVLNIIIIRIGLGSNHSNHFIILYSHSKDLYIANCNGRLESLVKEKLFFSYGTCHFCPYAHLKMR
jgi:hypothetical protein